MMAMGPGKAQTIILEALELRADDNAEAETFFRLLGLRVVAKRIGRTTEPEVTVEARGRIEERGGWAGGDGDTWLERVGASLPIFDMTAIMPWVTNRDESEAISAQAQRTGATMPDRAQLLSAKAAEWRERQQAWREFKARN